MDSIQSNLGTLVPKRGNNSKQFLRLALPIEHLTIGITIGRLVLVLPYSTPSARHLSNFSATSAMCAPIQALLR